MEAQPEVSHFQSKMAKPRHIFSALTSDKIESEKQIALSLLNFRKLIPTHALKNRLQKTARASFIQDSLNIT